MKDSAVLMTTAAPLDVEAWPLLKAALLNPAALANWPKAAAEDIAPAQDRAATRTMTPRNLFIFDYSP